MSNHTPHGLKTKVLEQFFTAQGSIVID